MTLLLTRGDVAARLTLDECITAVEHAFALQAEGAFTSRRPAARPLLRRGELSEVVVGRKPGRRSPDDVVIFDSPGVAIEDVAAAAMVYENAIGAARGIAVELGT